MLFLEIGNFGCAGDEKTAPMKTPPPTLVGGGGVSV
jgi:hypothetical protein